MCPELSGMEGSILQATTNQLHPSTQVMAYLLNLDLHDDKEKAP